MYEIEGIVSTTDSCMYFLNRWIPFSHKTDVLLKPKKQRVLMIEVHLVDETSG